MFRAVPPAPPFPEALHLRKVCGVVWCYAGADEEAAAEAIAPLLDAVPEPLMHGPTRCRTRRCRARSTGSTHRATSGTGERTS